MNLDSPKNGYFEGIFFSMFFFQLSSSHHFGVKKWTKIELTVAMGGKKTDLKDSCVNIFYLSGDILE